MMNSERPGIATMLAPEPIDYQSSIVIQVYNARELLSLAERQADQSVSSTPPDPKIAIQQIEGAVACLRSASVLSKTTGGPEEMKTKKLLLRAISSAEAALGHVHHFMHAAYSGPSSSERSMMKKRQHIWRRSAEAAKKETHVALAHLCEAFPDAYDREEL